MNRSFQKYRIVIVLVIAVAVFLFRYTSHLSKENNSYKQDQQRASPLNRNIDHLILTKHARCRMDCRNITEEEVKEILHEGNINYNKTNLNDDRGASYALEGYTHEHQHLRIIFAPKQNEMVVVTCIDLDKEWQCDCK